MAKSDAECKCSVVAQKNFKSHFIHIAFLRFNIALTSSLVELY